MDAESEARFDADAAYERFLRGEVVVGDAITDGREYAAGRIHTPVGFVTGETLIGGRLHIPCWRVRMGNGQEASIPKESAVILGFGPTPGEWEGRNDAR